MNITKNEQLLKYCDIGNTMLKFLNGKCAIDLKYFSIEVIKKLCDILCVKNIYEIPTLSHVVVSIGLKKSKHNKTTEKALEDYKEAVRRITIQEPVVTMATKSIAEFGIRKGMPTGLKVTLRNDQMYNFMVNFVQGLLNIRDFKGISIKSITQTKNSCQLNVGLRDIRCFPTAQDKMNLGCNISFVSKLGKKNKHDVYKFAAFLYCCFHIPFKEIINNKIDDKEYCNG